MPDWVIIFVSVLNVTFTLVSIIAAISSGRSAQKSLDHEKQLDSFRLKASTSLGFLVNDFGVSTTLFTATVGNVGSKQINVTGVMFEIKGAVDRALHIPKPVKSDLPKLLQVGDSATVHIVLDQMIKGLEAEGLGFTVRARFSDALGDYHFSDWHTLR